jgi:predicted ArsR family transcriptional regulator
MLVGRAIAVSVAVVGGAVRPGQEHAWLLARACMNVSTHPPLPYTASVDVFRQRSLIMDPVDWRPAGSTRACGGKPQAIGMGRDTHRDTHENRNRDRQALAAIALLADEVRGRLYRFVRAQPTPVTRDQAAAAVGISRKLAAFHLDKLTTAGLLQATTPDRAARPPGRGRAPKAYRAAHQELTVSIPQRRYDLLGELLTQAIAAAGPAGPSWRTAEQLAGDHGQALGVQVRRQRRPGRLGPERALTVTAELLGACGYEPVRAASGLLLLGNCPFQALVDRAPQLVCALNRAFAAGLLQGLAARRVAAVLDPAAATDPHRCCVRLQAATH